MRVKRIYETCSKHEIIQIIVISFKTILIFNPSHFLIRYTMIIYHRGGRGQIAERET